MVEASEWHVEDRITERFQVVFQPVIRREDSFDGAGLSYRFNFTSITEANNRIETSIPMELHIVHAELRSR